MPRRRLPAAGNQTPEPVQNRFHEMEPEIPHDEYPRKDQAERPNRSQ